MALEQRAHDVGRNGDVTPGRPHHRSRQAARVGVGAVKDAPHPGAQRCVCSFCVESGDHQDHPCVLRALHDFEAPQHVVIDGVRDRNHNFGFGGVVDGRQGRMGAYVAPQHCSGHEVRGSHVHQHLVRHHYSCLLQRCPPWMRPRSGIPAVGFPPTGRVWTTIITERSTPTQCGINCQARGATIGQRRPAGHLRGRG